MGYMIFPLMQPWWIRDGTSPNGSELSSGPMKTGFTILNSPGSMLNHPVRSVPGSGAKNWVGDGHAKIYGPTSGLILRKDGSIFSGIKMAPLPFGITPTVHI